MARSSATSAPWRANRTAAVLQEAAETLKRRKAIQGRLEPVQARDMTGEPGRRRSSSSPPRPRASRAASTPPRAFNMMFETHVGALRDDLAVAYLRPETAQGMFVDFKNVVDTGRVKLPFGIAQIGKSFRNEITPRNFIFRSREVRADGDGVLPPRGRRLGQVPPGMDRLVLRNWLGSIGLPDSHLSEYEHPEGEARLLFQGDDRHHVPLSLRGAGAVGHRRPRQL